MVNSTSLDGEWRLYSFPEGSFSILHPDDLIEQGLTPIRARVPGNVELDYVRAGLIPDPFYAANIHKLRSLETYEWWYLREFDLPEFLSQDPWELVFAGLDTLATVWVNGVEIGQADNMLVEQRFDVSGVLKPGQRNGIAVRIASALNHARRFEYEAASMSWERREEGLYIRKPPHCWGWDIMPRAVSAGIWRPVWLEPKPACAIEQLYYWTIAAGPEGATLGVRFQFRVPAVDLEGYSLHFEGSCSDHTFTFEWPVEFIAGGCQIPIPQARLWWPKGYGPANLYQVTASLCRNGEIVAERSERIGLRKLDVQRSEVVGKAWLPVPSGGGVQRIDTSPDPLSHFLFSVNGQPIQVRGTNWVPLDAFHSRDAERLEPALALVDDLGCNMIRCWGGNVYEGDRFYDICDEKGILVWQDFAFACCRYPQTEDFLEKVRREIWSVAIRLRNHPSLAIWCGDNEIDMAYQADGLSPEQNRLTRQAIPQTLHRFDPYRAYVPSSPYIPPDISQHVGSGRDFWTLTPEQHLWGPRGYFKSRFYTEHSAHFIGEIGYHGCPSPESIRRFISPEKVWPWQENEEWRAHDVTHWQRRAIDRDRIQLMANQVREFFGEAPDNLETFALASQITQAEAKKFFIESTRLRKWHTSGLLWWNVLDGWPQFSDAVADYYFVKKLAYHYIRRSQQPVCLILGEPGSEKYLPLVICNDSLETAPVIYRVRDADSGKILLEGEYFAAANANWQVGRIRTFSSDQRMYLIEWETGGQKYGSHYLSGFPPISLDRYRGWLSAIAALPRPFDLGQIAGAWRDK